VDIQWHQAACRFLSVTAPTTFYSACSERERVYECSTAIHLQQVQLGYTHTSQHRRSESLNLALFSEKPRASMRKPSNYA